MLGIKVLDIVIVLLVVGGSLNGLRIGAARQMASLIVLYISVVLTTRFSRLLLPYAENLLVGAPSVILETVLFVVVLVLLYALLTILIFGMSLVGRTCERGRRFDWRRPQDTAGESLLSTLNHLGGIVVGFITIGAWIGIGLLVYRFLLSSSWLEWEDYRYKLLKDYQGSVLLPVFQNFFPYILRTIEPWLPEGLPPILQVS